MCLHSLRRAPCQKKNPRRKIGLGFYTEKRFLFCLVFFNAVACIAREVVKKGNQDKNGGSGWIRTTDLTLIRGAL